MGALFVLFPRADTSPGSLGRRLATGIVVVAVVVLLLAPGPFSGASGRPGPYGLRSFLQGTSSVPSLSGAEGAGVLLLNISANPSAICSYAAGTCAANTTTVRITLSAAVPASTTTGNASDAQVLFITDITPFTFGCYIVLGCGSGGPSFTNESNTIHYFLTQAGNLTAALQAANPGMNLTFGLAETSTTNDSFADGDGWTYHVDVPGFANATTFGTEVSRLSLPSDIDNSDNWLDSAAISGIYGGLNGVGLNWTAGDRHVLVYIGAAAPRAPGYSEDICALYSFTGGVDCYTPTCEPAANFSGVAMPACEGWTNSTTGNASASLVAAAIAGTPTCLTAFASVCPIDVINVNATPTNPYSTDWLNSTGLTSGSDVWNDTHRVLDAGCALANATNGSWDGPTWYSCGGKVGTLGFNGSNSTTNPTFAGAVTAVSLGPTHALSPTSYVSGADAPLFQFVPAPHVTLAPSVNVSVSCSTQTGAFSGCASMPVPIDNGTGIGWNWSADPTANRLYPGDHWTASFDVVVTAAPGTVPLDQCTSAACLLAEGTTGSEGTGAAYRFDGLGAVRTESFPLATVSAEPPLPLAVHPSEAQVETESAGTVNLTVIASGGVPPYRYSWKVPAGTLGVASGPTLTFSSTQPGVFVPVATVVDDIGTTFNLSMPVVVEATVETLASAVPLSPGVGANLSLSGNAPFTIGFQAQGMYGVGPYAYAWQSGDGQSATTPTVDFTYGTPGQYSATITVTDAIGYTSAMTFAVAVGTASATPSSLAVTAHASYGNAGCGGTEFTLTASATGGDPPYTFAWSFGDGTAGTGGTVSHLYAAGHYSASVTVTDAANATATTLVPVGAAALVCGTTTSSAAFPLLGWIAVGAVIGAAGLAVGIGVFVVRRRKRAGPTRGSRRS